MSGSGFTSTDEAEGQDQRHGLLQAGRRAVWTVKSPPHGGCWANQRWNKKVRYRWDSATTGTCGLGGVVSSPDELMLPGRSTVCRWPQ
jgi:hypothetical protein